MSPSTLNTFKANQSPDIYIYIYNIYIWSIKTSAIGRVLVFCLLFGGDISFWTVKMNECITKPNLRPFLPYVCNIIVKPQNLPISPNKWCNRMKKNDREGQIHPSMCHDNNESTPPHRPTITQTQTRLMICEFQTCRKMPYKDTLKIIFITLNVNNFKVEWGMTIKSYGKISGCHNPYVHENWRHQRCRLAIKYPLFPVI